MEKYNVTFYSGGLEIICGGKKSFNVKFKTDDSSSSIITVEDILQYMKDHIIQERLELFLSGNTVYLFIIFIIYSRPGILVLINDVDWELEGELKYQIQDGDELVFISTLHGG